MKSNVSKEADVLFIKALEILMHSWGHDTPPEAFWTKTGLVKFRAKLDGVSPEVVVDYLSSEFPDCEEMVKEEEPSW